MPGGRSRGRATRAAGRPAPPAPAGRRSPARAGATVRGRPRRRGGRGVVPSSQRTCVAGPTSTGPGGTTSSTLTRVVWVAYISRLFTARRTWAAFGGATAGRSWTRTETASPAVTTLPCRVSRSSGASRLTTTCRSADTTTVCAGRIAAARTSTCVPSATPRFDRVSSSQSSRSGAVPAGAGAASAPVRRAPSSRTTSSGPMPSAASTCGETRTRPRDCSSTGRRRTAVSRRVSGVTPGP